MHATHTTTELIGYVIALVIVVLFVLAIVQVIDRLFAGKPEIVDDEAVHFQKVKSAMRQLPDGSWVAPTIAWEPCAAPLSPNDTEPHYPNDPNHFRNCVSCQVERKRKAGMAARSSLS